MIRAIAIVGAIVIAACATAGNGSSSDASHQDSAPKLDSSHVTTEATSKMDAAGTADAFVPHDASVQPAAQQGGGFCSDNTMCISSECCWIAICVPGTGLGSNLCFPM